MKIKWSVFFALFSVTTLMGCGSEQFGTVPKSTSESASPLSNYSQSSCSAYTLIKPKVDIIYVIDNSSSSYYIASDIKSALSTTISSLSTDFDYRVIGTPLIETSGGNDDFQVITNSSELIGIPSDSRRVSSASEFSFFGNAPTSGMEKGLSRIISFIEHHKNTLIRKNSHLLIVLVSNGRDLEIEEDLGFSNGETVINQANYAAHLTSLRNLKSSLNSLQLRMISVTAKTVVRIGEKDYKTAVCKDPEYRTALKSYVKMSQDLYTDSMSQDNNLNLDSYDLCSSSGVSSIFSAINNSIKQVILPHKYRYWPITFAENNETVSIDEIRVKKISPNGSTVTLTKNTDWFYEDKGSPQTVMISEFPDPEGEPVTGRHFIRFNNLITYPDCILVTSVSRTEYFNYIVLPQKPKVETISVRINGEIVPKSMTNGWSDQTTSVMTRNIKAPYPSAGDENPPIIRTGFMLKLNGTSNYYKSGDRVDVNFIPAGI